MKELIFILKRINKEEKSIFWLIFLYTLLFSVYPFIWIFVPANIIKNLSVYSVKDIIILVFISGIIAAFSIFIISMIRGNYRMKMNKVRYTCIRDLLKISLTMPYEKTMDTIIHDKIRRSSRSIQSPTIGMGRIILSSLDIFAEIIIFIGLISILYSLSFWIVLIILFVIYLNYYASKKKNDFQKEFWDNSEKDSRKFSNIYEVAIDPIRKKDSVFYSLFSILESYLNIFKNNICEISKINSKKTFGMDILISFANLIRDIALFSWISFSLINNKIELSDFFIFSVGIISLVVVAHSLSLKFSRMKFDISFLSIFIDFVEESKSWDKNINQIESFNSIGFIEIKNISFKYPNTNKYIFKDFSLNIKAGEKIAIVGINGAGKSTLINLICRLYKLEKGQIMIDGIDIWKIPFNEYIKKISVVFQDSMLLPYTIRENITMSSDIDEYHYNNIINQCDLDKLISSLYNKDDSYLLKILDEKGVDLSGGQKQKLFLARAIYKKSSSVLILDEPTAALDAIAESELYQKYSKFSENKTSIFISHRLASTKFCDRIIFIDEGKIIEEGSHENLMQKNSYYKEIFDIQAKNYRGDINEEYN